MKHSILIETDSSQKKGFATSLKIYLVRVVAGLRGGMGAQMRKFQDGCT